LRRTAAVRPGNRVLGIKSKDLSPITQCLRHLGFYGGFKFAVNPISRFDVPWTWEFGVPVKLELNAVNAVKSEIKDVR
jgi:hypothetical protein